MKPERFSSGNPDTGVPDYDAASDPSMKPERFSSGNTAAAPVRPAATCAFNEAGAFQLRKQGNARNVNRTSTAALQ